MPRPRRSLWIKLGVPLVVLVGLGAAIELRPRQQTEVGVVLVARGAVRDVASSSTAGEVMPLQRALVRTEVPGRVLRRSHDRGETVKKGAVVVALDTSELDARLREARAALAAAHVGVTQAQVTLRQAEDTYARNQALFERKALGAEAREQALSARDGAKAALLAARARVAQGEAALQTARVARERSELRAPFDGLLADVVPYVGDEVIVGAPIFEIIDAARLRVEANLDEADASRAKVGQPVEVTLDALPGVVLRGAVSQVGPALRRDLKGARVMPIRVDLDDTSRLRAGMGANVRVVVAERQDVLYLPSNAVVGRGFKRTVFVVEGGKAHVRPIETGLADWERTEIKGGLREGESVISTLNVKGLDDGVPVKVKPAVPGK
ncbi:MAG: efflux RND transporter periplasmic adaptor subunit [Deltaproteobacteria bacterium]|nr:efflux RND transporter periplasmic adaptor subunit [Deltaproteobacteria bacterium]